MIEVLLTTLETEMSTKTVDQGLFVQQIAQIVSKVHESVGAAEKKDGIATEVAYQFIKHLENNRMFREKLIACERHKWADFLMMLPYSKIRLKVFEDTLTNLNAFLTKPLLEILEI